MNFFNVSYVFSKLEKSLILRLGNVFNLCLKKQNFFSLYSRGDRHIFN